MICRYFLKIMKVVNSNVPSTGSGTALEFYQRTIFFFSMADISVVVESVETMDIFPVETIIDVPSTGSGARKHLLVL